MKARQIEGPIRGHSGVQGAFFLQAER